MRRIVTAVVLGLVGLLAWSGPASACGGLIGPRGSVNLLRTTTLAGYHEGVEHYVTSFEFAGAGGAFGSIVPLPGVPTKVEKGGQWTLQRLSREVEPPPEFFARAAGVQEATDEATVLLETRIDALDLTVLSGGAEAVGKWARDHGFVLTPDAPEVLEFYARRSPIFLAARFDGDAASERGTQLGDGTPIHLTIPTQNPWVPLRILALGRRGIEPVQADIFLLTDDRPRLLAGPGLRVARTERASDGLLDDLRSDDGMGWVPENMWLTFLRLDATADQVTYDLAVDADGREAPSRLGAGLLAAPGTAGPGDDGSSPWLPVVAVGGLVGLVTAAALYGRGRTVRASR